MKVLVMVNPPEKQKPVTQVYTKLLMENYGWYLQECNMFEPTM